MNWDALLPTFESFPVVLRALVSPWSEQEVRRRPSPGAWSVLEICAHLVDEEREDFRPRILTTLDDPDREWLPIDPEGWVEQRGYDQRRLSEVLEAFSEERRKSVELLRGLTEVNWDNAYQHPALGTLRAGDLLSSWLSHDALHLRQLARRHFERVQRETSPYDAGYAGPPEDWTS